MLLQFIFGGLVTGAVVSLVALGWVLIYNVSGVLNLAQGEFVMIGALTYIVVHDDWGWGAALSIPFAVLVTVVVGVLLDMVVLRRLKGGEIVPMVLVTVGMSFVLREIAKEIFGKEPLRTKPLLQGDPLEIGGAYVVPQTLLLWSATVSLLLILTLFFARTLIGKAMRACSENSLGARAVGISPNRMRTIAFGVSAGLGAIAGILVVPLISMSWTGGSLIGLKGFIAAVFGGFGSLPGAVIGAVVIGLFESLSAGYISSAYKDVFSATALVIVLLVRPQGLLGSSNRDERQAGSLIATLRRGRRRPGSQRRSPAPTSSVDSPTPHGHPVDEHQIAAPSNHPGGVS